MGWDGGSDPPAKFTHPKVCSRRRTRTDYVQRDRALARETEVPCSGGSLSGVTSIKLIAIDQA